jgi:hypothetical protein
VLLALAFASLAGFLVVGSGLLELGGEEIPFAQGLSLLVLVVATAVFAITAFALGARLPPDSSDRSGAS